MLNVGKEISYLTVFAPAHISCPSAIFLISPEDCHSPGPTIFFLAIYCTAQVSWDVALCCPLSKAPLVTGDLSVYMYRVSKVVVGVFIT